MCCAGLVGLRARRHGRGCWYFGAHASPALEQVLLGGPGQAQGAGWHSREQGDGALSSKNRHRQRCAELEDRLPVRRIVIGGFSMDEWGLIADVSFLFNRSTLNRYLAPSRAHSGVRAVLGVRMGPLSTYVALPLLPRLEVTPPPPEPERPARSHCRRRCQLDRRSGRRSSAAPTRRGTLRGTGRRPAQSPVRSRGSARQT